MAMSLGTKGYKGTSLVQDVKTFKQHFEGIDWSKKEASTTVEVRKRPGKTTYVYAEKKP